MKKVMLSVSFDEDTGFYGVSAPQGSTVNECIFCCAVIARTFIREKFVKDADQFIELLRKYALDPQFAEVEPADTDEKGDDEDGETD